LEKGDVFVYFNLSEVIR